MQIFRFTQSYHDKINVFKMLFSNVDQLRNFQIAVIFIFQADPLFALIHSNIFSPFHVTLFGIVASCGLF